MRALAIHDLELKSRFFLGSAGYPSLEILEHSAKAADPGLITVSLRRELGQSAQRKNGGFWESIRDLGIPVLPNTAGCRTAEEAVTIAQMAREIFATNWIKLEVIGCQVSLQPDPFELVKAASILNAEGFEVFPYTTEDAIVAEKLLATGCKILMPWGAPIGSGQGLLHKRALKHLRERFPEAILVVDAGIGRPSHACEAMELGYDAVLVNTAVSQAGDPVRMANAFAEAIRAGRAAYEAHPMSERSIAVASTPIVGTPFWQDPGYQ